MAPPKISTCVRIVDGYFRAPGSSSSPGLRLLYDLTREALLPDPIRGEGVTQRGGSGSCGIISSKLRERSFLYICADKVSFAPASPYVG
jgi:hypothetical protein